MKRMLIMIAATAALSTPTLAQDRTAGQRALAVVGATLNTEQGFGTLQSFRVTDQGADNFSAYRGEIKVDYSGDVKLYRWGGAACPGKDLSDRNVMVLAEALGDDLKIKVETKLGAGSNVCLVGFTLKR